MLYKKRRFTVIDSLFSIAVSYLFSESRLIRRLMNFLKGGELPLCNCVLSNSEISLSCMLEFAVFAVYLNKQNISEV
jgi:hypothetical protein